MDSRRRQLLIAAMLLMVGNSSYGQMSPPDVVPVYLVPLDDFPEDLAGALARALQQNLNFRVKASLRLPPLQIATLPGTNQYLDNDILVQGARASVLLPEASASTYRLFLTLHDINSRSGNLRFEFSAHNKALNCSVVSLARLLEYKNETPVLTNLAISRLIKMTKRAIGELYLGWSRSNNPSDLMFAPIMGVGDLDRIGLEHETEPKKEEQKPLPPAIRGNAV